MNWSNSNPSVNELSELACQLNYKHRIKYLLNKMTSEINTFPDIHYMVLFKVNNVNCFMKKKVMFEGCMHDISYAYFIQ